MISQTVVTKFRLRVYTTADGSIEVLLGVDQLPDPSWTLVKDQDVVDTKVIVDHVEPSQAV